MSSPETVVELRARVVRVLEAMGDPPWSLEVECEPYGDGYAVTIKAPGARVHLLNDVNLVVSRTHAGACRLAWRRVVKVLRKRHDAVAPKAARAAAALAVAEGFL